MKNVDPENIDFSDEPQRTVTAWLTRDDVIKGIPENYFFWLFIKPEHKDFYKQWRGTSGFGSCAEIEEQQVLDNFGPDHIMPGGPDSIKKLTINVPIGGE